MVGFQGGGFRWILIVTIPNEHRCHADLICTGNILQRRITDKQYFFGMTGRLFKGLVENFRIRLARPGLFAWIEWNQKKGSIWEISSKCSS